MSIHPAAHQLLRCMVAVINALEIIRIINYLPLLKTPCSLTCGQHLSLHCYVKGVQNLCPK